MKQKLIDRVLQLIEMDVNYGDFTALEELLTFCPPENLLHYLPDGEQKKYDVTKM